MSETVKRFLLSLILIYQRGISPWLGSNCRFYPSCSEWAKQALETYGVLKGTTLALRRLLSCHPLHSGGYHPLKENG